MENLTIFDTCRRCILKWLSFHYDVGFPGCIALSSIKFREFMKHQVIGILICAYRDEQMSNGNDDKFFLRNDEQMSGKIQGWAPTKGTVTLQGINISLKNGILKMIFLFPRWDMLILWRV